MRKHRFAWLLAALSAMVLMMAACSDVDEGGEDPGSGDTGSGDTANVAQCGDDTITIAVNPWVGA
jgi:hypothetical protein